MIDLMKETDILDVAQIFKKVFNGLGENWSDEVALAHVTANYVSGFGFVSREGEIITGFLLGIPTPWEQGTILFIDAICVLPEHAHHGVGKLLWEKAERHARDSGFQGIRLMADPSLPSYRWYEQMGFVESGWKELFHNF